MKTPLVSVVIPVYNRGARVQPTVQSALDQTLSPEQLEVIEVIIVDDGSTDDTVAYLQRAYGSEQRVRVVTQENGGVARARNRGLAEARGKFIAFLDHDDLWMPQKLERQLAVFEKRPDVGVVYCLWIDVDESGVPWPAERQITRLSWWQPQSGWVYPWLIRYNSIVSMSLPLIRTAALRAAGGFDPGTAPCDDWDLWLRLARHYRFDYVAHPLVFYTRHEGQQSHNMERMAKAEKKTMRKQWRYVWSKPPLMWFVAVSINFTDTLPLYREAKEHLFAAHRLRALSTLGRVALRRPLALLAPQWLYLAKRLITKNTAPF